MSTYACVKDGIVSNTIIIEDVSEELLNLIKSEHEYDDIIIAPELVAVGHTFDGTNFLDPNASPEEDSGFPSEVESEPGFTESETPPNLNEL